MLKYKQIQTENNTWFSHYFDRDSSKAETSSTTRECQDKSCGLLLVYVRSYMFSPLTKRYRRSHGTQGNLSRNSKGNVLRPLTLSSLAHLKQRVMGPRRTFGIIHFRLINLSPQEFQMTFFLINVLVLRILFKL